MILEFVKCFFVDYDRLHFASKETQMKNFREFHWIDSMTIDSDGGKVRNWHLQRSLGYHSSYIHVIHMQISYEY